VLVSVGDENASHTRKMQPMLATPFCNTARFATLQFAILQFATLQLAMLELTTLQIAICIMGAVQQA